MKNNISVCALGEFVNEVQNAPEEASVSYGVRLDWQSGARSHVEAKSMKVGPHKVSRSFSWIADEPRQLLGSNHAPNPQEYLLSGFGACMMMAFVSGATARGIQLESVTIDVEGELDLHGFLGLESNKPVGFSGVQYKISVAGDASEEQFRELQMQAEAHSPNAMTLANPIQLTGEVVVQNTAAPEPL